MTSPLLLDCTLRDGGFVNDWNFGFGNIKSIISRLDYAGVDIIEIGFIDESREYDENRSIFPDSDSVLPIFKGYHKYRALIIGMIDYGTCSVDRISNKADSCLDGIRVIFKKNNQDEALEFLSTIKAKGYRIFVNPVSITEYSKEEAIILAEKINLIEPYAVSIVDTYGLMHSKELIDYYNIFDENLSGKITIGYHAHNNFQMAYANSIALINRRSNRQISVDGSLYGMGKGAGNACTELLAMYMNEYCERNFDLNQIQEAVDIDILKEYRKKAWGYNFEHYIAALNDCHPLYVQYLLDKRMLSVKSVNEILMRLDDAERLSYDCELIERVFREYQDKYCDDTPTLDILRSVFSEKKLLLLGPGKTLLDNSSRIDSFIAENDPIIVSINLLHESFPIDYVFMGNAIRFSQFFHQLYRENANVKIICTSNITEPGRKIDYTVSFSELLSDEPIIRDNPLTMFLHLLRKIGTSEVWLAGFDGYTQDNFQNYYDDYVRLLFSQENLVLINEAIKKELSVLSQFMQISSLTPTRYLE